MTKKKKIALIIAVSFLALLSAAVLIYYYGERHTQYFKLIKEEFDIPGLNDSFVPQGFEFDEISETYFISGYMSDNSPSRIYYLKDTSSEPSYITLLVDGEDHMGHLGGVASNGEFVWVSSDGYVYRLSKDSIINANNSDKIEVVDYFKSGNGADSITVFNDKLWVGEFYIAEKYETKTEHHINVSETEINRAVAYVYSINNSNEFGIESTTPEFGVSLPDKAQGFDFTEDGKVIVSTSYSIPKSHIYIYDNPLNNENSVEINIDNNQLTVYILSSKNLIKDIKAPSMSEEVVCIEDKILILYESDCSKWRFVNRTRIDKVHSFNLNDVLI